MNSYNKELKEINLVLEQIYLDPNNPRFSDNKKNYSEDKITDSKIQSKTLENMERFDIESLIKNIEINGFLKIDRIIVRKIKGIEDSYVVVEGNRRLASLKMIQQDLLTDELLLESIKNIDVLLYEGDNESITWFFQGIRHISGIKEWSPYQQAVLLDKTIKEEKINTTSAGEKYGIGRQISARLLRTLYALNNFKNDEEYGDYAKNEHFSIFEELIKNPTLKEYFGWDEKIYIFENIDRIKLFYQWIQDGIINSAVDDIRKRLPIIITQKNQEYIDKLSNKETTLEDLYHKIKSSESIFTEETLSIKFNNIINELNNIPLKFLTEGEEKKILISNIKKLQDKIDALNNVLIKDGDK